MRSDDGKVPALKRKRKVRSDQSKTLVIMRVAVLVFTFLLSITWAEKEIGELLDTARDRLRCVSNPKCIDRVGVQRLLHVTNLKVAHFTDVSMVMAHHLLHGDSSCTAYLSSLDIVEDEVMRAIGTEDIPGILRIFRKILKDGGKKKCTGVDDILREMILPPSSYSSIEWVRSVLAVLMDNVMKGYCLEETAKSGDSLDNLFYHYGDECSPYLSAKGLEKMMNDLEIAGNDHDHNHHHDHDHLPHEHDNHNHECDHHHDHDNHNHDHECDHHHDSKNHDHSHDHSDINHKHFDHSHAKHEHPEDDQNRRNQSSPDDHSHHEHSEDEQNPHNHTSEEDHNHHGHDNENNPHSDHDYDKDDKLIYVHGNHSDNHSLSGQYPSTADRDTTVNENGTLKIEVKLVPSMESVENRSGTLENVFASKLSDLWHPTTLASEESNVVSKIIPPTTTLSRNIPAEQCLSAESLVSRYGSDRVTISKSEFLSLCPVIVNQRVGDACEEPTVVLNLPSKSEIYGYSSIAVAVLCLASLSGALLLPLMRQNARHYIIAGFQGLAFSTLASDALLHLIPEFLGLHSHDHSHGHSHSHEEGSFPEPYAQLLLGVFATIYVLFMMEAIFCALSGRTKESSGHGHSHGLPPNLALTEPTLISVKSQSTTQLQMSPPPSCTSLNTEIIDMDTLKKPPNLMVNEPVIFGLTSMALVITLGDALHNFGDGLAIGAAFSANIRGGISTAAAGLCHELPHELGDFIVLLSSGLSYSKALIINFLSSLTCFAGLYVGIVIGDNTEARKWVMAATASTFLYVALAEMIPELREHRHGSPIKMLLAKNLGIILGVAIMCLISVYEHQMS